MKLHASVNATTTTSNRAPPFHNSPAPNLRRKAAYPNHHLTWAYRPDLCWHGSTEYPISRSENEPPLSRREKRLQMCRFTPTCCRSPIILAIRSEGEWRERGRGQCRKTPPNAPFLSLSNKTILRRCGARPGEPSCITPYTFFGDTNLGPMPLHTSHFQLSKYCSPKYRKRGLPGEGTRKYNLQSTIYKPQDALRVMRRKDMYAHRPWLYQVRTARHQKGTF